MESYKDKIHGRVIWSGLMTDNMEKTKSFYSSVAGWTFSKDDSPLLDNPSFTALAGKDAVAGFYSKPDNDGPGVEMSWRMVIAVRDVDEAQKNAEDMGAYIIHPITGEKGQTRFFFAKDPCGALAHFVELTEEDAKNYLEPPVFTENTDFMDETKAEDEQVLESMRHFKRLFA